MRVSRRGCGLIAALVVLFAVTAGAQPPFARIPVASSHELKVGGATLQVDFAAGTFDIGDDAILQHVRTAAEAVSAYYGRFPVARDRVLIVPVADRSGVMQGTTWGDMGGWPAFTRIRIGEHITQPT